MLKGDSYKESVKIIWLGAKKEHKLVLNMLSTK